MSRLSDRPSVAGTPILPLRLRRDIVLLLILKLVALLAIYQIFFTNQSHGSSSAASVTQHLLSLGQTQGSLDGSR